MFIYLRTYSWFSASGIVSDETATIQKGNNQNGVEDKIAS